MRNYIILFLLLIFSGVIMAENASNIRVRQEGKNIVIVYDLSKRSVVRVLMASGNSSYFTELKAVTGNVGKGVPAGPSRKIVWHPLEEKEQLSVYGSSNQKAEKVRDEFVAQNVRFKVEALSSYEYYVQNAKVKTLVMGQVGYSFAPQFSYGGMIGQMYNGIGWYANFRSNFNFLPFAEFECNAKGAIYGEVPFYTGKKAKSHLIVTGGFMINFLEWSALNKFNTFGMYLGGGYGKRELQWEIVGGSWAKYMPTSSSGFSGNLGFFGSISGVTLSVGLNTINFKYVDVEAGIGFMF